MKSKKAVRLELKPEERQMIEDLREHPELMARVQSLLTITRSAEGPLKTADEVEDLLIEEMRRLGSATMSHWANQAEERVSCELKSQDPTVRSRRKKY